MSKTEIENEETCQSCSCKVDGTEHECPFKSEINNNDAPCNCCDKCRYECAMAI